MVEDFYKFNTYETFAKTIATLKKETLCERYNNSIIVLDEVHNLRIQDKEAKINK